MTAIEALSNLSKLTRQTAIQEAVELVRESLQAYYYHFEEVNGIQPELGEASNLVRVLCSEEIRDSFFYSTIETICYEVAKERERNA